MVRDHFSIEVLHQVGFSKSDVDDTATNPGNEAGGVGEIDEPVEDDGAATRAVEVGEWREERRCYDGHV